MNRRASLPGVDELFGTGGRQRDRDHPDADTNRTAADPSDPAVVEARALLRQLTADEGDALRAARDAADGAGADLPSPEVGALLRWAVTVCQARAVVEVGSAAGVSGLRMLEGMPSGGVLTSVEPEPDTHRLAASAFAAVAAGSRVRSIHGDAGTLLERLADASYDLVLLQSDRGRYPEHLTRARMLLRPGGMLVARGILPTGEHQQALTRFLHDLVDDAAFSTTVLPVDDGVALANRLSGTPPA